MRFFWILLLCSSSLWAQIATDSTKADSLLPVLRTDSSAKALKVRPEHSPRKAVLLGTFLPGAGQIYNRKYWKLPIVYGGMAGIGYWMISSRLQYQCYRKAYFAAIDGDSTTVPNCAIPGISNPSTSDLNAYRKRFRSQSEMAILAFTGFYLLVLADAFVDAHLYSFDVSDDLSMRIKPQLQVYGSGQWGSGLRLQFQPKGQKQRPQARW